VARAYCRCRSAQTARASEATLGKREFECVEAEDAIGALQFACDDAIDLIVTEIDTPRLYGVQLLRVIQNGGSKSRRHGHCLLGSAE
jgi:DNA-binding response OmpR family regulator